MVELLSVYLERSSQSLEFKLNSIAKTKTLISKSELACAFLSILEARMKFIAEDYETGHDLLNECEKLIEKYRSVPKIIYSSLHSTQSIYFWKKQDFENFYTTALKFLAYSNESKISQKSKILFAE